MTSTAGPMSRFVRTARVALSPARYHGDDRAGLFGVGWNGRRPFFEGWYYKLVDRTERYAYAIIPGIFRGRDLGNDHAFVQVLDGQTGRASYIAYPIGEFAVRGPGLDIAVGPNRFSATGLELDLAAPDLRVEGQLSFHQSVAWPTSLVSPSIMGWYSWVPLMECYHGVLSLDHGIEGSLRIGEPALGGPANSGLDIDFTGGRGYLEKDWGRAFPAAWVWTQSNHFGEPDAAPASERGAGELGTSVTASVAIIPWLRGAFAGFIVGLLHGGKLYRFATYTGAKIERLEIGDREIYWTLRGRRHRLELSLARGSGGLLRAPDQMNMDRRIAESLDATVEARLTALDASTRKPIFAGVGRHAGLEAAGDLQRLMELYRAAS